MNTVLIIDDDDKFFLISAIESVDRNIQVFTASDGLEGLDILQNQIFLSPDYIFLDLNMPKLDGFGFLQELNKQEGLRSIPVIINSTSSDERDIALCKQLGAKFYMTKPSKIEDIYRA